ncbi:MAG TPA: tetratricopeptide repeat protein [Geobacteraceae bacterium]
MLPSVNDRVKLMLVFLVVAVAAAYAPLAHNGFVTYDDPDYLTENATVLAGLTGHGIGWAFTTFHAGNWHPLTWLGHMVTVQLFGLQPFGHHLASLLLHCANTTLVLLLMRRLGGGLGRSAAVALLFGLHPLHVESVAWVAELKDLLCAFFFLLTLISHVWYVERQTFCRYALVVACCVMALMSKPMAVTLPAVLLLLDYWPLARFGAAGRGAGRLLLEKAPLVLLAAAASGITFVAQRTSGFVNELDRGSVLENAGNALLAYVAYLGKLFWPTGLAIQYPFDAAAVTPGRVAAAGLLLLGVTALVLRWRQRPYLAVGWFWYLGTLVPVIGVVSVGSHALADRYTYLPSLGICIMLVWGVAELGRNWPAARPMLAAGTAVACVALGVVTWRQVGVWHDSGTLYRHALQHTRDNWLVHNNLGVVLTSQKDVRGAFFHLSESVRLNPDFAEAHYNLGILFLYELHNGARAIDCFRTALRLDPKLASVRLALGKAYVATGQWPAAQAEYRTLQATQPELAQQLAEFMAKMGGGVAGRQR